MEEGEVYMVASLVYWSDALLLETFCSTYIRTLKNKLREFEEFADKLNKEGDFEETSNFIPRKTSKRLDNLERLREKINHIEIDNHISSPQARRQTLISSRFIKRLTNTHLKSPEPIYSHISSPKAHRPTLVLPRVIKRPTGTPEPITVRSPSLNDDNSNNNNNNNNKNTNNDNNTNDDSVAEQNLDDESNKVEKNKTVLDNTYVGMAQEISTLIDQTTETNILNEQISISTDDEEKEDEFFADLEIQKTMLTHMQIERHFGKMRPPIADELFSGYANICAYDPRVDDTARWESPMTDPRVGISRLPTSDIL